MDKANKLQLKVKAYVNNDPYPKVLPLVELDL